MRSDLKTNYTQRDTERAGQTEKALYLLNTISAITDRVIIPGLFEPPVRTLRATIPENESHIFR